MAKIDHTFHMDEAPEQAQQRFEEEIGWELHRGDGFVAVKEMPGEIDYSDAGVAEASDEKPFLPTDSKQVFGNIPGARGGPSIGAYAGLRELLAHKIKVELTPDGSGTHVRIHGHGARRLRDAIERLGQPGHWPELRWTEGAPTEDR